MRRARRAGFAKTAAGRNAEERVNPRPRGVAAMCQRRGEVKSGGGLESFGLKDRKAAEKNVL